MHIKRFVAKDMRDAIREIRRGLGPDAVILSNRTTDSGVEVIAAVDYDDSLLDMTEDGIPTTVVADAAAPGTQTRSFVPPATQSPQFSVPAPDVPDAPAVAEPAPAPTPEPPSAPASDTPSWNKVFAYQELADMAPAAPPAPTPEMPEPDSEDSLRQEVAEMRRLLETQLASLAWNDLNRQSPVTARVVRELSRLGVDAALTREIAQEMPALSNAREAWRVPLQLLAEKIPLLDSDLAATGGRVAVVGPTGVGKTTSIAKIAARFVLRHGVQSLGLVSTDTYRIGAREQLLTFARILGAPMHVAENARELRSALDTLGAKKLVLIDTAGMSQRDVRLANQFATLQVDGYEIDTYLALSAAAHRDTLAEAMGVFAAAAPKALILTKLDEASVLGPALSVAIRAQLPIAYLSDGQRVPEDFHPAANKRLWLLQQAITLAREHARAPEEFELAHQFSHVETRQHA
jgi:flagellar biosynthesis protein FlhF